MSKKGATEVFQSKITRNDRFAQMSHQEKVIEEKKKEIQARLEQKQKGQVSSSTEPKASTTTTPPVKSSKSLLKSHDKKHGFNVFSNDGSFLDQYKQLKDKKVTEKTKLYKSKDGLEKNFDDRNKSSRWSQTRGSQSPKERVKPRITRFSDKPTYEPKINITTTYSNLLSQATFENLTAQNAIGQPLLKNLVPPPSIYTNSGTETVITAPPVLLNMPPPQIVQNTISSIVVPTANDILANNVANIITPTTVLTTVTLPPPAPNQAVIQETVTTTSVINVPPPIELTSIPPPNPIQVHNIPQPDPLNALTIPPPAPIQVQNIPPPSPIQLNEIPNPKPLDIVNIPTPSDCLEKNISDPDFIKNVPPPNKSVPPPNLEISLNITVPPPTSEVPPIPTCLPPPNVIPPTTIPPPQNILVQTIPPQISQITGQITNQISNQITNQISNQITNQISNQITNQISNQISNQITNQITNQIANQISVQTLPPPPPPPPPPQNQTLIQNIVTVPIQNQVPVGVPPPPPVTNNIPSLMAQPVLPPPGMGIAPPINNININCPPPLLTTTACPIIQAPPPPTFVNQPPPPMTGQMPPMNIPPPTAIPLVPATTIVGGMPFRDMTAVFPAGTADYEAMASLGRMVAQCGPGIEDVVRQRKTQDPSLWFLFHKESAAYRQYQQLVEQFKMELEAREENSYQPEDTYEQDGIDDDDEKRGNKNGDRPKRKRKSRWGDKDMSIPPPTIVTSSPGNVLISKITRSDPALIQYAMTTYGSTNLSEDDWRKVEDHYKINILYQEMIKKRQEVERLKMAGKNKYEYDSDEEIEGGTWEHRLREKEMVATQQWANELTRQAEGKHHIGDFLPPEELKKFMEKSTAVKEGRQPSLSDYKEFKLKEDNIGFKMLQKLGWSEGQGLGSSGAGIVEPVNKGVMRDQNQGLGLEQPDQVDNNDDEYESYRKRMMLAYRFRPNPLNNPRRPYY
ncbi:uncharacterized protein [Onthophagus taurus]|uniref:uncharacterized protein isoform X1 n=1 Tax=Onthophagus taurus TaxID=166361 RepID=UPI0039BE1FC4